MKYIFFIAIVLNFNVLYAQNDCLCNKNFEEIKQKVSDNYAAFNQKVNIKTKPKYDELTKKVAAASKLTSDPKECFKIIKTWTDFFEDGHLFINTQKNYDNPEPIETLKARANAIPDQKYTTEGAFTNYIKLNEAKLDPVEGIYFSDDKAYKIGIIKDELVAGKFYGFLLEKKDELWKAGKTKFKLEQIEPNKYKATYYYSDFTSEVNFSRLIKNVLMIENIYKFEKISPIPNETVDLIDQNHKLPDYRVEKIDAENTLVVLPPFTMANAGMYSSELIKQNAHLIRSTKHLIIDLRNNPGGDESAFDELMPFIAQGKIVRKGSKMRATEENLILLNHELKSIQDFPQFKNSLDPKLRELIRGMQMNMGKFYDGPDKVFEFPKMENPQKVIILVNKNTASTAESISLEAKQSTKTIIMGTNTKGFADYTEVRDWGLQCYGWRLAFALGLSYRLPLNPIENIGIKPDVQVPAETVDWVSFAIKYLNQNPSK